MGTYTCSSLLLDLHLSMATSEPSVCLEKGQSFRNVDAS